jgi:hypothetical protein
MGWRVLYAGTDTSTLSHGDGALGAGAEDCIARARRLWRAVLGGRPGSRPPRRRLSPAPLFTPDEADCRLVGSHEL